MIAVELFLMSELYLLLLWLAMSIALGVIVAYDRARHPRAHADAATIMAEARAKVLMDRMRNECPMCNDFGVVMKYIRQSGWWIQITCAKCRGSSCGGDDIGVAYYAKGRELPYQFSCFGKTTWAPQEFLLKRCRTCRYRWPEGCVGGPE